MNGLSGELTELGTCQQIKARISITAIYAESWGLTAERFLELWAKYHKPCYNTDSSWSIFFLEVLCRWGVRNNTPQARPRASGVRCHRGQGRRTCPCESRDDALLVDQGLENRLKKLVELCILKSLLGKRSTGVKGIWDCRLENADWELFLKN